MMGHVGLRKRRHLTERLPGYDVKPLTGDFVPADFRNAMTDAMSDPAIAERLPFDPGVLGFIRRVLKGMKERGDLG